MKKILLFSLMSAAIAAGCSSHTLRPGNISLTWSLADHLGRAISCDVADGVTMEVTATPIGGGANVVDLFDCADMAGTTDSLPGGDYTVRIRLLDSNDNQLNLVNPTTSFRVDGQITNIGNFVFQFSNI